MPLLRISSKDALKNRRQNNFSDYPSPKDKINRLVPHPLIKTEGSFSINEDTKIFSMGSCFAREIDNALKEMNFKVLSRMDKLDNSVKKLSADFSLYNKYTIHSILNEIRWALDPSFKYNSKSALHQLGPDSWTDPQLGGIKIKDTYENMVKFRKSFNASMKKMALADLIIITLGLVETWYDRKSKLFLNRLPDPHLMKKEPKRFQLVVLSYTDIVKALNNIYDLVKKYGNPETKFLVTVSPVPLQSTFRDMDILIANTYSKSVQRAALDAFVMKNKDVDYFPSYEHVMLGDLNNSWNEDDYRHVRQEVVNRIMSEVMKEYIGEDYFKIVDVSKNIKTMFKEQDYAGILQISETIELEKLKYPELYKVGLSYKYTNDYENALRVFESCYNIDNTHSANVANILRCCVMLKNKELFTKYTTILHQIAPEKDTLLRKLKSKLKFLMD